jgi:hypothetical protein
MIHDFILFFFKFTRSFECLIKLLCTKIEFLGLYIPLWKNLWQQVIKRKETKPNKQQFIISPKQHPVVLKSERIP